MSNPGHLNDKHVVVVGGGTGIGWAVAALSFRLGARVIISSRNAARLEATASELGDGVACAPVDMTDEIPV